VQVFSSSAARPKMERLLEKVRLEKSFFFCAKMRVDEEKRLNFSKRSADFDARFPRIFTGDVTKSNELCF